MQMAQAMNDAMNRMDMQRPHSMHRPKYPAERKRLFLYSQLLRSQRNNKTSAIKILLKTFVYRMRVAGMREQIRCFFH